MGCKSLAAGRGHGGLTIGIWGERGKFVLSMTRLLIIEDDKDLRETLAGDYLEFGHATLLGSYCG